MPAKLKCNDCGNVQTSVGNGCLRCDSNDFEAFHEDEGCWVWIKLRDGSTRTLHMSATMRIGSFLSRKLGETGSLYVWNAKESLSIPRENILGWRLYGEYPREQR